MKASANKQFCHARAHSCHPREGGDPARGNAAIYKNKDQTPAFAGVTIRWNLEFKEYKKWDNQ